jgi:hypothetical protein
MPINQLSTANTFEQWLISTQILIEQSNFFQDTSNATLEAANTTINLFPIILSSANQVSNDTSFVANTANIIFDYVGAAFDVANTVLEIALDSAELFNVANMALSHANGAFITANGSFNHANGAFITANGSFNHANGAFITANAALSHANGAFITANGAFTHANGAFAKANTSELVANSITTVMIANTNVTSEKLASNLSLTGNLTVQSSVNATDFNSTSDISLKDNIIRIENSLDILEKITGISFTWKENNEISYGLSAQEVEKVLPGIVKQRSDGIKGINYTNLIAFLIEAIKELKLEIENLKNHK